MFTKEKEQMIRYGMLLDRYQLIALSGGNLTMRMPTGEILITPSGMIYEEMVPDDIIVMDINSHVIEGRRKPSSDTDGILYILQHRADINAVIHTHQPYATAVGIVEDTCFPVNLTTLGNVAGGNVPIAPYSSPGSVDVGKDTVAYLGTARAVILAHHGVMTVGSTLKDALYTAVYMEEAAKCYLAAKAVGIRKFMTPEQIQQTADIFRYYGQDHEKIPETLLIRR